MEGNNMLNDLENWLVKVVLKDAYLTVPIGQTHQKHKKFQWNPVQHLELLVVQVDIGDISHHLPGEN